LDRLSLRFVYWRRVVGTGFLSVGIGPAMAAAKWIARGVYDLQTPAAQRTLANLQGALGDRLDETQRQRLARHCFEHIAAFWIEALYASRRLRPKSWRAFFAIPDEESLQRLCNSERPAIFVTTYFGNFAAGAFALGQLCRPLHVVVEPQRHPLLRRWQDDLFHVPNLAFIERIHAIHLLPDVLAAGGKVLLIGEHARSPGRRPVIRYLNRDHACHPTVTILSQRHDAVVVPVANRRMETQPFRFRLDHAPAIDPRGFADDATTAITQAYMSALERFVLSAPEQYLWTRRRVQS
jgi:lauroyl/myristoyl acyltransferase